MDAVGIGVVALGEDEAEKWSIKVDVYPHVSLFTLHLNVADFGRVVVGQRPNGRRQGGTAPSTALHSIGELSFNITTDFYNELQSSNALL